MLKSFLKPLLFIVTGGIILSFLSCEFREPVQSPDKQLKIKYSGDAKIEVGGPFVGIEMHHSSPLLQRISFFYPVANSLDESTDYWKRDTSYIMQLGLKIGDGKKEIIGKEPFTFDLTPYYVDFHKSDKIKSIDISYRFTKTKPAMVVRYEIKNESDKEAPFEFYTYMETTLRTSHSYFIIDSAWTEYDNVNSVLYTNFDNPQTQSAQIFIINTGEKPSAYNTVSSLTGLENPDTEWLNQSSTKLNNELLPKNKQGRPAAKFIYTKVLKPQESMVVTQIIGSCKQSEGKDISSYLIKNYQDEINSYEQLVLDRAFKDKEIITNDSIIDQSVHWAKAILEANTHYLDGDFVPMPCPAEYNFYFTHDVLKTDLAAVSFDTARVKRDLKFIIKHANEEKIIPHAYYWKDDGYKTELAAHDNWNNFWFIIVSGSYLRHSGDIDFLKTLYPYIQKSLVQALQTKGNDNLMWSRMPDWWDIGDIYGPRAYMTILAVKAIREYIFISAMLGNNLDKLAAYEQTADSMHQQLISKLWDNNLKYLINYYEPGKIDDHYYIGSLLAAHYGLLDKSKLDDLVNTAGAKLLDKKVGIYNVFPMDFNKLKDLFHFAGNEAGDPFLYANGGIWPHGNAWYALALMADGKKDEALNFIKNIMTIKGVMNGPNGQPAMYEVRCGNYNDSTVYGTVDKPQFLWAAGWYLYTLYHLYALQENEWNIYLDPFNADEKNKVSLDLYNYGNLSKVTVDGKGSFIKRILYDGKELPTGVIPSKGKYEKIEIFSGIPEKPYLKSAESVLNDCQYNQSGKLLSMSLKSYQGHNDEVSVVSPFDVSKIMIDDKPYSGQINTEVKDSIKIIKVRFTHNSTDTELRFEFK